MQMQNVQSRWSLTVVFTGVFMCSFGGRRVATMFFGVTLVCEGLNAHS